MKVYLVGGAVRDELLGMAPEERDWVVVGASAQQLLDLGYRQVGRDFPVFLHPESGDEYALARTERKKGHGYTGFEYDSDRSVTLEQDLQRRDLTINAMARTDDGELIDPYGGRSDLEARVLRHVSPAFVEDPLRVLRVARFAARFHDLGFRIAPETAELMRELTDSGELAHLVPERIWQETLAALMTDAPHVYVQVLRDCGALQRLFPELERLFGVPQTARYHPEIDTGIHLLLCLKVAARLQASQTVRVAVLLHDLGKGVTPEETLPSHIGHERAGLPLVRSFGERLKLSRNERELAELVCLHHLRCHQAVEMKPASLLRLLEDLDAWRRPQRFEQFLLACEIDARGRKGLAERSYASRDLLQQLQRACASVSAESIDTPQLSGPALGDAIRRERGRVIADLLARLRCVSGNG